MEKYYTNTPHQVATITQQQQQTTVQQTMTTFQQPTTTLQPIPTLLQQQLLKQLQQTQSSFQLQQPSNPNSPVEQQRNQEQPQQQSPTHLLQLQQYIQQQQQLPLSNSATLQQQPLTQTTNPFLSPIFSSVLSPHHSELNPESIADSPKVNIAFATVTVSA